MSTFYSLIKKRQRLIRSKLMVLNQKWDNGIYLIHKEELAFIEKLLNTDLVKILKPRTVKDWRPRHDSWNGFMLNKFKGKASRLKIARPYEFAGSETDEQYYWYVCNWIVDIVYNYEMPIPVQDHCFNMVNELELKIFKK